MNVLAFILLLATQRPDSRLAVEIGQPAPSSSNRVGIPMCSGWITLEFTVPDGWSWDREGEQLSNPDRNASVYLGCYKPGRASRYLNFSTWAAEELAGTKENHPQGDLKSREFRVGPFEAMEVTYRSFGRAITEVWVGVATDPPGGHIFEIVFQSVEKSHKEQDAVAFKKLVESFKVVESSELDGSPPN